MIMFTSGTTGVPKGVCQHITAITANASHVSDVLGLAADDRIFINTPPYFTSGICHFLTLMSHGGGVTGQLGFFFGENLLAEMDALGCTGFGGAPAHLVRVVEPLDEVQDAGPPALLGQLRRPPAGQDDRQAAPCTARRAPLQHVRTHRGLGPPLRAAARRARPARGLGRRADRRHDGHAAARATARRPGPTRAPSSTSTARWSCRATSTSPRSRRGRSPSTASAPATSATPTPTASSGSRAARTTSSSAAARRSRRSTCSRRCMGLGLFRDAAVIAADDDDARPRAGRLRGARSSPTSSNRRACCGRSRRCCRRRHLPSRVIALDEIPRTGSGKAIRGELRALLAEETGR